ncbi:MAG: hypothetical protein NTW03_10420 [Verrucomicrobia bacterium]|nr:hypothetical protein [Verrucomicrobiota bacterium]
MSTFPSAPMIVVQAAAPGNLIPEGATDAAVRYVARGRQAAMFYCVSNSQAIVSGMLRFTVVKMRPVSQHCVEVIQEIPGSEALPELRYLDSAGVVTHTELPDVGMRTLRATRRDVQRLLGASGPMLAIEATLTAMTSARPADKPRTAPASRPVRFVPAPPPPTLARPPSPWWWKTFTPTTGSRTLLRWRSWPPAA